MNICCVYKSMLDTFSSDNKMLRSIISNASCKKYILSVEAMK